jgi:mRNA-degrading endonuclease RelE of RelBE toxin-antitoxin system
MAKIELTDIFDADFCDLENGIHTLEQYQSYSIFVEQLEKKLDTLSANPLICEKLITGRYAGMYSFQLRRYTIVYKYVASEATVYLYRLFPQGVSVKTI